MIEKELPDEIKFLQKRKKRLQKEIARIEALEANLRETRELLDRNSDFVGVFTKEEYRTSGTYVYTRRFLDGTLTLIPDEIKLIKEK